MKYATPKQVKALNYLLWQNEVPCQAGAVGWIEHKLLFKDANRILGLIYGGFLPEALQTLALLSPQHFHRPKNPVTLNPLS